MKILYSAFPLFILLFTGCKRVKKDESITKPGTFIPDHIAQQSNSLIAAIRDGSIDKPVALDKLKGVLLAARAAYYQNIDSPSNICKWVFPIQGYGPTAIGGVGDEGYVFGHYDFFDGNKHSGHTALDIFIHDSDQDCLDDRTGKETPILSATGGIVIAAEYRWDTASILKGGKYIWIFDPVNNFLQYYAHNNQVIVKPGQIVKPGDQIATCGRTGLNAWKKRSPTHLHFMLLQPDSSYYPRPVNPYNFLLKSKIVI
jgi:murein DD-endopeptidase MepM/ murein hydrolase activator NlpD